jgi:putative DNA primase/helicase
LTQEEKVVRPLGTSDFPEITRRPFVECTGNNLVLVGDLVGRSIRCTINAKCERPELRKIKRPHLLLEVRRDRGRYAVAALTIIQAFLHAQPEPQTTPLGNFEKWSTVVRDALIWLGCADPCDSMEAIRRENPEGQELAAVMRAWEAVFGLKAKFTVKQARITANDEVDGKLVHPDLRDAFMEVAADRTGEGVNPRRLGKWLSANKGKVVGGRVFSEIPRENGAAEWCLESN